MWLTAMGKRVPGLSARPQDAGSSAPAVVSPGTRRWEIALALLLAGACLAGSLSYVGAERTFYSWDTSGYWVRSLGYAEALRVHPWNAWKQLGQSVAHEELSLLPAVLPATWILVFGGSREAYVASLACLYAVPAFLLLFAAVGRLASRTGGEGNSFGAGIAALLLLAPVWTSVVHGQVGVAGVAPALALLLLTLRKAPERWELWESLAIGALLVLLFLVRRWWAFWSVAAGAAIAAEAGWAMGRMRGASWRARWQVVRGPAVAVLAAPVLAAILAGPRIASMLSPVYSTAFAAYLHAYRSGTGPAHILRLILRDWGGIPLVALLWAGAFLTIRDGGRVVRLLIYMTFVPIALLFTVQDPSLHHWMLVAPAGALLLTLAIQATARRRVIVGLGILSGLILLVSTYVLPADGLRSCLGPLIPGRPQLPEVRSDVPEIARLLDFLDGKLRDERGTVYVLSSSAVLNGDTLRYANISRGWSYVTPSRVLPAAVVDVRDGFPIWLVLASYVVTTEPVQLSLAPSDQDVVRAPWALIRRDRGFGEAFRRLPRTFRLENGVRAVVFERWRASTSEEINDLTRRLRDSDGQTPHFFDRLHELEEYLQKR